MCVEYLLANSMGLHRAHNKGTSIGIDSIDWGQVTQWLDKSQDSPSVVYV